jgi:pyridoxal phosphate enzyme (YggS family)
MDRNHLTTRFEQTLTRISSAATSCGRNPEEIHLIAVSKMQPVSAIRALYECGQRAFAENYLQEALPKLEALKDLDVTWHFTGQLQANKTRSVAEHFAWVHALDRERIAIRLNDQRPHHAPPLQVCLQVRLGDEAGKGGVEPNDALALAREVIKLPRLRLRGLMCIPPPEETFAEQKAWFDQLAACQREIISAGIPLDTLSMGMSGDLEAAIVAGATCVRIGTALFGERPPAG